MKKPSKKSKEISNKTLVHLLIATIVISLGGTFISLNAINSRLISLGQAPITGFAVVPNATATVTVQGASSIQFSDASIAFGSGAVDTEGGFTNCTLSTLSTSNNAGCTGFSEQSNGLTIENDGNTNLSVTLETNVSPNVFIGVDSALFLWNVTVNKAGSCVNGTTCGGGVDCNGVVNPNTTADCSTADVATDCGSIFENVSESPKTICPRLLYADANDALDIDINITIPLDAPLGSKIAGFIVRGTRDPTS